MFRSVCAQYCIAGIPLTSSSIVTLTRCTDFENILVIENCWRTTFACVFNYETNYTVGFFDKCCCNDFMTNGFGSIVVGIDRLPGIDAIVACHNVW